MASVQFDGGKCHGAGEAKAMLRHADRDERLVHEHSNEDIDKSKTPLNTDLHGLSYRDMCERYDRAIKGYQQRASKAIRKDAVTLYDAIITVPKDLPADREDDWFRDVEKAINDHYGKMVVMDIKIHRDEIHEYTDPATKQRVMSRTHGHCFMIPDVDGRLNAKKFSSRANMRSLNREIDELTREKYQVQFLTGEKTVDRGFQTVEQLKRTADNEELIRQTEQSRQSRDAAKTEQQAAEQSRDRAMEQARKAKQQRLDALRERDAARADRDVTKALVDAQERVLSPVSVDVDILAEKDARKPLFGQETPATVTIPREDLERLQEQATVNGRTREAAKELWLAYNGMQAAARDANENRIDKQAAADRAAVSREAQRADGLERELSWTRQELTQEKQKTAQLSEQLTQERSERQEIRDVLAFFQDQWRDMKKRTKRARAMEKAYEQRYSTRGKFYVTFNGEEREIRDFLMEYLAECKRQGIPHDTDMSDHLKNLLKHDRDRDRDRGLER